ncbi:hypothetical protein [Nocardioides sp.]|uniref:hypothetical protein n=1 Tax=Nocardioides sp. TaxID=35761 RepID=UPI002B5AC36B|nr:hypothetical protein [Nocardioides sp.]HXH78410.1 hypothetical protein [Nocardioides sp.]
MTALLAVVVALTVLAPLSSYADTECGKTDAMTGICLVWVEIPGEPGTPGTPGEEGPKGTGSGEACYWDPSKQGLTQPPAGPVPCESDSGYWSNTLNCYVRLMDPQPPAGDPAWQGHEPADGAVYLCYQPQTEIVLYLWSANPPDRAGTGPTPRVVAQQAIATMGLKAVRIGITPEPGDDSIGIVGMPVWMWAKEPDAETVGPTTASASTGGITVTATATLHKVTWSMGDGTKVVCTTAGTPYEPEFGMQASPDCGHTYGTSSAGQDDDKFTVTATSDWVVSWSGAGQTGTIRLNGLTRSARITVGEAQVLVQ